MRSLRSVTPASVLLLALLSGLTGCSRVGPDLVVQITVDQLREDVFHQALEGMGPGGFRRIVEGGLDFKQAFYDHSITYTAVGHATLVTGGRAAQHGMAANDWYDRQSGNRMYSVEDSDNRLLGERTARHAGTSPRNLTSSTIGDELVLAGAGRSRAFAVSVKDRGAIIPAGQYGKAFWYSTSSGRFVTSSYYYDEPPDWLVEFNTGDPADAYRDRAWSLLSARDTYRTGEEDDRPYERQHRGLGRTFPHELGAIAPSRFYSVLRRTPFSDELTLELAKELIRAEGLGHGRGTDYLSISLSATDYIGHSFGPWSLEYEDNLHHLDRALADLLDFLDEEVGLERVLLVLSSDHGVAPIPEQARLAGRSTGRLDASALIEKMNRLLGAELGVEEPLISVFWKPGFYLDQEVIRQADLDPSEVESRLAVLLAREPGVGVVLTRTALSGGASLDGPAGMLQHSFHPERSGDVLIAPAEGWLLETEPWADSTTHGSPWSYDTHVPLVFSGSGIPSGSVLRRVGIVDLAPTVAAFLGIPAPSGSAGSVLPEVLGGTGPE